MKRTRRVIALVLAVMLMCSMLCIGASAASYKNKSRTFYMRLSNKTVENWLDLSRTYAKYEKIGKVTIKSTSTDGKTGTITITEINTLRGWYTQNAFRSYCVQTVYNYKIANMKDGGKITLTLKSQPSGGTAKNTLTGNIYISGSKDFNHIWKIDGLGCGFYLRST